MTYFMARCELCTDYIKLPDVALAFRLTTSPKLAGPKTLPEVVELDGKQPWSGIRIICKNCVEFVTREGRPPRSEYLSKQYGDGWWEVTKAGLGFAYRDLDYDKAIAGLELMIKQRRGGSL